MSHDFIVLGTGENDEDSTEGGGCRLIIAGSRYINDFALVERAVELSGLQPTVILSGTCRGVDLLGERWAKKHGVPVERFPAAWTKYPNYAGNLRNGTMIAEADALLVIWEGWDVRDDGGAADVILKGLTAGIPVFEYTPTQLRAAV